jgi:PhnB protein
VAVKPIPDGYHSLNPYLTVSDLPRLVRFLEEAFGGRQTERVPDSSGAVTHAEVRIGDSVVMIGQARGEWTPRPSTLYFYVEDCQATFERALAAGAKSLTKPARQFYGDMSGGVEDPLGNWWWIATHVEDVSPEELARRVKERAK